MFVIKILMLLLHCTVAIMPFCIAIVIMLLFLFVYCCVFWLLVCQMDAPNVAINSNAATDDLNVFKQQPGDKPHHAQ